MDCYRDDFYLREGANCGTWSPYLIQAIEQIASNDRYLSDRFVNLPLFRLIQTTDVDWPKPESEDR